jgi:hypothetical protein
MCAYAGVCQKTCTHPVNAKSGWGWFCTDGEYGFTYRDGLEICEGSIRIGGSYQPSPVSRSVPSFSFVGIEFDHSYWVQDLSCFSLAGPPPVRSKLFSAIWELRIPPIPLMFLFLAYPVLAYVRGPLRRWRRKKKGQCLKCGYNLTGNVTGVCSECGMKIDMP